MPAVSCPSLDELKQFRQGRLPEERSLQYEQHLVECPSCLSRIPSAVMDDPFLSALGSQRSRPRLSNPLMDSVRQEMRSRAPRPTADLPTAKSVVGEATVGDRALAHASHDATVPFPTQELQAAGKVELSFLSPPRGPGELGWLEGYRVLRLLGEGGMGAVLLAVDTKLHRQVALKVMKPDLAANASAVQRFLREASATAQVTHDHVIAIHHISESNGVPYLAMPLLQGETLDDRLRREGVFSLAEVLRIGREIALGLSAAHEKGLIHRDIKPSNIWLESPSGRVKILDFGLAVMANWEGEKTLPGTILGTPGYMAPEQTEGEADARADLFSLGCVLYRMATGQLPFKGQTSVQKIRSVLMDTPLPPQQVNPALPPTLGNHILKLLSRKPQDRPQKALVVARVLETFESHLRGGSGPIFMPLTPAVPTEPPAAIPVAQPTRSSLWSNQRFRLLLGAGVLGLVLFSLVIGKLVFSNPGSPNVNGRGTKEGGGKDGGTSVGRPNAMGPQRPSTEEAPPEPPAHPPRTTFKETWVTKPQEIKGLKGWAIEADQVGAIFPIAFDFLKDERMLINYRYQTGIPFGWYQFDPATNGLTKAPFGGVYSAITADGLTCARVVPGGVQLWDQGSDKQRTTLRIEGANSSRAAFSPNGTLVVALPLSGPAVNTLHVWDARTGDTVGEERGYSPPNLTLYPDILHWAPDSKTLAIKSNVGIALFKSPWRSLANSLVRNPEVVGMAWSPDSKLLAILDNNNQIHLLDPENEKDVFTIPKLKSVTTPAWSPHGSELAFGTEESKEDYRIVVWNLKEKKVTHNYSGHKRKITAVAFYGDGKTLISGSTASARFWDLRERDSLKAFRGTLLYLNEPVAISPEGYYRCSLNAELSKAFMFKFREKYDTLRELTPKEFSQMFGWQNFPERVKLTGD